MNGGELLLRARQEAGLSQEELATRSGTSRSTLSAYEHGHRSPTLRTAHRILDAAGHELVTTTRIAFTEHETAHGRPVLVPSRLPRLDPEQALALVNLPVHLNWSGGNRTYDLGDRRQRARVYEITLREGGIEDLLTYVDGVLLAELWGDLVLPRSVRAAWEPLVGNARTAV